MAHVKTFKSDPGHTRWGIRFWDYQRTRELFFADEADALAWLDDNDVQLLGYTKPQERVRVTA